MDVEKTIEFLLENAARSSVRMDRLEASMRQADARLDRNERLTFQLIGLMSGQQTALAKLSKAIRETNEVVKETSETVKALGKRMDAFVAGLARGNGHGFKKKG